MARKLVCVCNFITEKEILAAIGEGARDLEDIKLLTGAGSSCGRCHAAINGILADTALIRKPDAQGSLF